MKAKISMISPSPINERTFDSLPALIAEHARDRGEKLALVHDTTRLTYAQLNDLTVRIAAGLQRDGAPRGASVAVVSATTANYAVVFLGILRAGCLPAPIAPSSTPDQVAAMIADSKAPIAFVDDEAAALLPANDALIVRLDDLEAWLPAFGAEPAPVDLGPDDGFNVIYSSGTTGAPKGIVHTHGMRWRQFVSLSAANFGDAVTLVSTPLYSNTTLVSLLPTLAFGGTAVLLGKFDARRFLELAERERATHAMLVPVQYQRIMSLADFDKFDLSSFRFKTCTSAPFSAELKADVVARWPGMLLEIYGMTEGGGACMLYANLFPDKLHTVGQPAAGHDIRLIDEQGRELAQGEIGEVVSRSGAMMAGYHDRPEATSALDWISPDGGRFIRHGDLGRFDSDGFLTLLGRSKDMIISGGFNIYPADIEAVLTTHPQVIDAAVIGAPSEAWGETPYAFFVTSDETLTGAALIAWANAQLGKTQRLSGAEAIDELPRNAIGKVLKRELRERFAPTAST